MARGCLPNRNFAAYSIGTLSDNPIKRKPTRIRTLSTINDIRFPYLDTIELARSMGKYWPIMPKDAKTNFMLIISLY